MYCLLLSLLIDKVWFAPMHCLPYSSPSEVLRCRDGVQLDFSAAFDSESQWSLIQIEIYCCRFGVLSICTEFLSDRRQRVVVDGAASEWILIISGVPQANVCWVLFYLFYIQAKCLSWLRTDDLPMQLTPHYSMAVVRKPAGRPVVAAFLDRDLTRIQEWCNHCMVHDTES